MGSNIYNTKIRIFWGMRNYYIFLRVHEKSGNEELGKQTQHPQVLEKKIQNAKSCCITVAQGRARKKWISSS